MKYVFIGIGLFIILIIFSFTMTNIGLEFRKYLGVKSENIERTIFEETQSYNHGMSAELADYYAQYNMAVNKYDKELIANVIKIKFADFKTENLRSESLKLFLTNITGY